MALVMFLPISLDNFVQVTFNYHHFDMIRAYFEILEIFTYIILDITSGPYPNKDSTGDWTDESVSKNGFIR